MKGSQHKYFSTADCRHRHWLDSRRIVINFSFHLKSLWDVQVLAKHSHARFNFIARAVCIECQRSTMRKRISKIWLSSAKQEVWIICINFHSGKFQFSRWNSIILSDFLLPGFTWMAGLGNVAAPWLDNKFKSVYYSSQSGNWAVRQFNYEDEAF